VERDKESQKAPWGEHVNPDGFEGEQQLGAQDTDWEGIQIKLTNLHTQDWVLQLREGFVP
jgi:hypothetical protein